ncbi:hypothetical protein L6R50_28220, partial [Myxococcota bacterium]|nr:hypothetical protein [Myxococcota bacterium]
MKVAGLVLTLALSGCSDTHIGPGVDDDAGDDDSSPSDDDSSPGDDDLPDDDSSPEDDDVTPDDDDDPSGCPEPAKPDCGDPLDADCDGTSDAEDCAPTDPWIHPGALEACGNLEDEDCDGLSLPCRREGEVLLHLDHPEGFDAAFTRSTPFAGVGGIASFIGDHDGDGWGDVLIGGSVSPAWTCVLSGPFTGVLDLDVTPEACVARFEGL